MGIVFGLIYIALLLFQIFLIVRIVFDLVQMFARQWRPRGAALVTAHVVYSVTDPPIKRIRRLVPPLQLGSVSLDLAFLIVFIVVIIAMGFTWSLV
ncbi:YggT family protein [Arthrobacter celericrescens]|uniref:YggT family protein n=1 Tax=Arthrobacter celericrescens TaxID=2320851 RepID=UPI000EA402EE|nr:YggT family protein [Arthrobacter celericrescens]